MIQSVNIHLGNKDTKIEVKQQIDWKLDITFSHNTLIKFGYFLGDVEIIYFYENIKKSSKDILKFYKSLLKNKSYGFRIYQDKKEFGHIRHDKEYNHNQAKSGISIELSKKARKQFALEFKNLYRKLKNIK